MGTGFQQIGNVIAGLRRLADEAVAIDAGTHSARIVSYAEVLEEALGLQPPCADLLAARELSAAALIEVGKLYPNAPLILRDRTGETLFTDKPVAVASRLRAGHGDDSLYLNHTMAAIARGRALERAEQKAKRPSPSCTGVPDRLTIFIDGPQGSGKTRLARWLASTGPWLGDIANVDEPRIIEMREGRPFDVVADVFVDEQAA